MMLKKSVLTLFILLFATMSALAQEPITAGESITIPATGTEIEYILDAVEGHELIISAVSEDFDTYLNILDADGNTVASDDDSGERLNAEVTFTVPADGSYTVVITEAYGAELSGEVTLSLMDAADVAEPTESMETTPVPQPDSDASMNSLEVNSTVEGDFVGEPLSYTFEAEADQTYTISLTSEDFDTYLELYDGEGLYVDEDDDGGMDTNSVITFTVETADTYEIIVRAFGTDSSGDFTLSIEALETIAVTVGEPTVVEAGTTTQFFTFEGEAGMLLDVYIVSEGDDDTYIAVNDPEGYEVGYDDENGSNPDPFIRAMYLPTDGIYQIELSSYTGEEFSDELTLYIEATEPLTISADPITYSVDDRSEDELVAFDVEEKGVYRLIVDISGSKSPYLYGTIYQPDDVETYYGSSSFTVSGLNRMAVDIVATSEGTMRVDLDLSGIYDETGVEVTVSVTEVTADSE